MVTALSARVIGAHDLLARVGTEEWAEAMAAVLDRFAVAIEAFGGEICEVRQDGVLALFGAPRAQRGHLLPGPEGFLRQPHNRVMLCCHDNLTGIDYLLSKFLCMFPVAIHINLPVILP